MTTKKVGTKKVGAATPQVKAKSIRRFRSGPKRIDVDKPFQGMVVRDTKPTMFGGS